MDPVPAAADAATEAAPSVVVSHDAPGPGRTQIVAAEPAAQGAVSLQGARIVVTVGRGIGGPDNLPVFRELADTLGAALGASRVVVDAGWLPFAHQVGQTGSTVAPDLYLAFGVSGAIQHLAGMRGSKRVIAVNLDSEAPLCRAADLVVPEDATEFAVRLLAAARQAGTPANAHGVAPEERPFSKTSADVVAVGVEQ
jgi:electron transfer flavoprotein alpha subunit